MVSATLTDTLDPGWPRRLLAISGPGLTFTAACNPPTKPTVGLASGTRPQGRRIVFDLGNVSNPGSSSATLTIDYTVVVPTTLPTCGRRWKCRRLEWTGGILPDGAVDLGQNYADTDKTADVRPPGTPITFTSRSRKARPATAPPSTCFSKISSRSA
jgi:hypothetical protein